MPGHKGIIGNEDADGIAKGATMEEKDTRIKVPPQYWRSLKMEEMWKRTQERIEKEGKVKGSLYFNRFYEKEKKKTMV